MSNDLKNINDLQNMLNEDNYFDLIGVDSIGVFGSFARGEESNHIDLLLENIKDKKKIIGIKDELERKIKKRIDIVFSEYANPIILYRAKKDLKYVKKYQK